MSSSPAAAKRLDNAVKEIDKNVTGVHGDADNLADLDRQFETIQKRERSYRYPLCKRSVGELSKPLGSITEKGFDDTFNVNVRGTLFTVLKGSAAYEGRRVNHSK